jgi:hypothetical protein
MKESVGEETYHIYFDLKSGLGIYTNLVIILLRELITVSALRL